MKLGETITIPLVRLELVKGDYPGKCDGCYFQFRSEHDVLGTIPCNECIMAEGVFVEVKPTPPTKNVIYDVSKYGMSYMTHSPTEDEVIISKYVRV